MLNSFFRFLFASSLKNDKKKENFRLGEKEKERVCESLLGVLVCGREGVSATREASIDCVCVCVAFRVRGFEGPERARGMSKCLGDL